MGGTEFQHLQEDEEFRTDNKKNKEKEKQKVPMVSMAELFQFASRQEKWLMFLGSLCVAVCGSAVPIFVLILGDVFNTFIDNGKLKSFAEDIEPFLFTVNITVEKVIKNSDILLDNCVELDTFYAGNITCADIPVNKKISHQISKTLKYFLATGAVSCACGFIGYSCWNVIAGSQSNRIRRLLFRNIMRQDVGWFDVSDTGEINNRICEDVNNIHQGMGDKTADAINSLFMWIFSYVVGFISSWELTLIITALCPLTICAGGIINFALTYFTVKEVSAYSKAGAVAEEILGAVRTVVVFGGEKKARERYIGHLDVAAEVGKKKGLVSGLLMGGMQMLLFINYTFALYAGAKLVRHDRIDVGDMFTSFFAVTIGNVSLGQVFTGLQYIAAARGSAYVVYNLIKKKSPIDSSSDEGNIPDSLTGTITFKDVYFTYPSREDVPILNGSNITVKPGQTVALVGSSGCGKSTLVQLIMRFYDPSRGQVLLDGTDIKDLNVKWLRQNIGLVSQEPVLFNSTIAENIRFGSLSVSMDQIVQASKQANAYDFIMALPKQFETMVGQQGTQLSGGQKQRIAIARALVRNPQILLLDEATSALDTESEHIVQDALDKARAGRTTVVIAHRLSTIRNADIIIGFDKGVVAEQGSHRELMNEEGIYYTLVTNQTNKKDEEATQNVSDNKPSVFKREISHDGQDEDLHYQNKISVTSDEVAEETDDVPMKRILQLNRPELPYIIFGCVAAGVAGASMPSYALILSNVLSVFYKYDKDDQMDEILKYCLTLLGIGAATFVATLFQYYLFASSGEALTKRIRDLTFMAILRQEIAWFDRPEHNTGALGSRLATDASKVKEVFGGRLGRLISNVSTIKISVTIGFLYSWRLSLVLLGIAPVLIMCAYGENNAAKTAAFHTRKNVEIVAKYTVEAVGNMRTVAALGLEDMFYGTLSDVMDKNTPALRKQGVIMGLLRGVSTNLQYVFGGAVLAYGAYLIEESIVDVDDCLRVFLCIFFSANTVGMAASVGADVGRSADSIQKIFAVVDRKPLIDSSSQDGKKPSPGTWTSLVTFKDARFFYPVRPGVQVLRGLNLSIEPGQTVALVGSSGCGKSTTVAILERLYDLASGSAHLDKFNIRELNIQWLRRQIGIVSQEPVLFGFTIAENIAYGDNDREIPMDEIIKAAKLANIHNFIQALPTGYQTTVGLKGTQLSGGQKQRVAIARALLRNPSILLLDEATSALDTESEKVVQEALNKAREGRTCITIAHRLSTIRDADKIVVIKKGIALEEGKHDELMAKKGYYYRLQTAQ